MNTSGTSDLEVDISSLQAQRVSDEGDTDTEISSLQAQRVSDVSDLDTDISSLQAQRVSDEEDTDTEISSLQAQRVSDVSDLDTDISSLQALSVLNDVYVEQFTVGNGVTSIDITFSNRTFATTPRVVATMIAGEDDPIIGMQLSAVSATGATFQFSDQIPGTGYKIEVMASV